MKKWLTVSAPSFAFAGVQASWAVQIGHGTAHLRKLGLSDELVAFAWFAGPITGLIVQPVVGAWSDRCTSRFGRRRPFMLAGAVGMAAGLLLFSNSASIAAALGDPLSPRGGGSRTGLAVAILAFWVVDTFTNALQAPARCLMADYAESGATLSVGNSLMAVGNGVGKIVGYAAGSITPQIEIVYGVVAGVALLFTLVTCIFADDKALVLQELASDDGAGDDAGDVMGDGDGAPPMPTRRERRSVFSLHTLFDMPRPVAKAFLIQCFTYFAFMLVFVYGANWAGKEVFSGSADAAPGSPAHAAYEHGILVANRGFLLMAIFSIGIALTLTPLCRKLGVKLVWSAGLVCFGACLMATMLVRNESVVGVYLVFAFLSFPLAVAFTIPWTVVSLALREALGDAVKHDLGAHLATFNGSQSFACLVAAVVGGLLVRLVSGDMARVLAVGGAVAIMGAGGVGWAYIPVELELM